MVTVRIIKIMSDDKFNAVEIYRLLIGNYAQKSAIKFYKLLIYNPYLRHRIEWKFWRKAGFVSSF
jgi:hypothetical protein